MKINQIRNLKEERDLEKDDAELRKINAKNKDKDDEKETAGDAAKRRSEAFRKKVGKAQGEDGDGTVGSKQKPLSAKAKATNDKKKADAKKSKDTYDSPEAKARRAAGAEDGDYLERTAKRRAAKAAHVGDEKDPVKAKAKRKEFDDNDPYTQGQRKASKDYRDEKTAKKSVAKASEKAERKQENKAAHKKSMDKIAAKEPNRARDIKKEMSDRDETTAKRKTLKVNRDEKKETAK